MKEKQESQQGDLYPELSGREILKLAAAVGVLGAAGVFLFRGGSLGANKANPHEFVDVKLMTATSRELCGTPAKNGVPVVISMLYSDDKRAWVEDAADRFARLCPNIQVKITAMEDIESAEAILNGEVEPTLWAPADDLVLRYLDHRWKERSDDVLFHIEDQTSLARSPLVVLIWEDRLRVVEAVRSSRRSGEGPWMELACALIPRDPGLSEIALEDMVPGRWIDVYSPLIPPSLPPTKNERGPAAKAPAEPKPTDQLPLPSVEEIQRWGRVKFVHTSPTRSASGLEALYLMAYDYALPPNERIAPEGEHATGGASSRPAEEAGILEGERFRAAFERALTERQEPLQRWLRRCEAGLDSAPESAQLLTETMFNVGETRYDGVFTYEHLTFSVLNRVDEHARVMRNVRVIYPQPTIVNQHPVVFLWPDDPARQEPQEAARRWIGFLRSKEMQEKAIEHGFRPANPEVSIRAYDVEKNPFLHLRRYGISFEPVLEEPPRLDGEAIQEIIHLWEDATGRN